MTQGKWRIDFVIQQDMITILVLAIAHRRDIYQ
jgi:mRNA-degrading endonuclease RelE of RelBE toxin-antitoxin system